MILRDRCFYPHQAAVIDYFSCVSFLFSLLLISLLKSSVCLFVLRFYGPINYKGHVEPVSLPIHTVPGHASEVVNQYKVTILSPVTDNCPTWISGRERMTVEIVSLLMREINLCSEIRTNCFLWLQLYIITQELFSSLIYDSSHVK